MKKILILAGFFLILVGNKLFAQSTQINAYEYWFNENYAGAVLVNISPVPDFTLNTDIPTNNLPIGLHTFHVRFRDDNNNWSSVTSQLFFKTTSTGTSTPRIIAYEYWFDENYAGHTSTNVAPAEVFALNTNLGGLSALSSGLHTLHIRFKDENAAWSSVVSHFFVNLGYAASPNLITAYRYWFDMDMSSLVTVNLPTPENPKHLITEIDASALDTSIIHTVNFQFKDLNDAWSSVVTDTFVRLGVPSCIPPIPPIPVTGNLSCPGISTNTVPTLSWESVPEAERYFVSVSRYPYGEANLVELENNTCIAGTSYTVSPSLKPGMLYRWDLSAYSGLDCEVACESGNSYEKYFYVPPIVTQTSDASGGITLETPELEVAEPGYVTYQWYRNGLPIGMNSNTHTAIEAGAYSVSLTYSGSQFCTTTSISSDIIYIRSFPQITISTPTAAPLQNVTFYLKGFASNGTIQISINDPNGDEHLISVTASELGDFAYIYQAPDITGEYFVKAKEIPSMRATILRSFQVVTPIQPTITSEYLKIVSPIGTSEFSIINNEPNEISVSFTDKMFISESTYLIGGISRNYWYRIDLSYDGVTWSDNSVYSAWIYPVNQNLSLSVGIPVGNYTCSSCRVRVTDMYDPSRSVISEPFSISIIELPEVSFEWDFSYRFDLPNPQKPNPKGVAADGVGRFLIKVFNPNTAISEVTISLSNSFGQTSPSILGKVMRVEKTHAIEQWSQEANTASSIFASSSQPQFAEEHWFWYVAPDDFATTLSEWNERTRQVTANISITYADGLPTSNIQRKIEIVRPPVILVHGLKGDISSWDNFRLSDGILFKDENSRFIIPPKAIQIDGSGSFMKNSTLITGNTNNSIFALIKQMRNYGYACNQVDYICHSMGGSILRYCMSEIINGRVNPVFYDFYNTHRTYGKGLTHKAITITTPHNGSLFADLVYRYRNCTVISTGSAFGGYYKFNFPPELIDAVKNLQVDPNGENNKGIKFDATPGSAKIHRIASKLSCEEAPSLNKLILSTFISCYRWNSGFDNLCVSIFQEICDQARDMFYCLSYDGEFLDASDLIVSTRSQLAGVGSFISGGSQTVFEELYHSTPFEASKRVLRSSTVADKTMELLNRNVFSSYFSPLNATPNLADSNGDTSVSRILSEVPVTSLKALNSNKIQIISPDLNAVYEVDSVIIITVSILDTNGLRGIDLIFQDAIYSLDNPLITTTFGIQVNGNKIGTQKIIAVGYYLNDGEIIEDIDELNVQIVTTEGLASFIVSPEMVLVQKDDNFRPSYTATFQSFSGEIINTPLITAVIENPAKLTYNSQDNTFMAVDTGNTHAIVTYQGLSDTIYFEIVHFPTSEDEIPQFTNTDEFQQIVCAGTNEILFRINTDLFTDEFRVIPEGEAVEILKTTLNLQRNNFETYRIINGENYIVVSSLDGEPILPGVYEVRVFVRNSQTGAYSDAQMLTLIVNELPHAEVNVSEEITCPGSDAIFTLTGTSGSLITYKVNDGPEQEITLDDGNAAVIVSGAVQDVTIELLSVEDLQTTCVSLLNIAATISVDDLEAPEISCPETQTLVLDNNCTSTLPDYTGMALVSDNCGIFNVAQSPAPGTLVQNEGVAEMMLTVQDINDLITSCSFSINKLDSTLPMAICNDFMVTFNGQPSIFLSPGNLLTASDNCGVSTITITPDVINCVQIGQVVPVTCVVYDFANNMATCSSLVTVSGLPCGWSQQPNGINCNNGSSVSYNASSQVFTLTSTNCYSTDPFTADAMAYTQRSLCGDGSITAQITNITNPGAGWAGIVMRESNATGAKKVQLMTNLGSLHRREVRYSTGGASYPQQTASNQRHWLRIVRQGNQFTAYTSPNGIQWYQVMTATVDMSACIEMGLAVTNNQPTGTVTATFANVSTTGNSSGLLPPGINEQLYDPPLTLDFSLFPNPTTNEVNINLSAYSGRPVRIELYTPQGQQLRFVEIQEVQTAIERLDLSAFANGMYWIKVKTPGLPDTTKRVVLTGHSDK